VIGRSVALGWRFDAVSDVAASVDRAGKGSLGRPELSRSVCVGGCINLLELLEESRRR
jgi:hypothetical protein